MDLLLWRHAEAEDGPIDLDRPLSAKGQEQARILAQWLSRSAPAGLEVLVSPALRCVQTAAALGTPYRIDPRLLPGASAAAMLEACAWPESRIPMLVVGHQPTLGLLASALLSGREAPWAIKKGALWWLSSRMRSGKPETRLEAAITANLANSATSPRN